MQIIQGNNVLACGTIAKDPEIKTISKGDKEYKLIELSLAVGKNDADETIWQNIECWGVHSHIAKKYKKGDIILIVGVRSSKTYIGRDGVERQSVKVKADFIIKLDKNINNESQAQAVPTQTTDLTPLDDDDLPF